MKIAMHQDTIAVLFVRSTAPSQSTMHWNERQTAQLVQFMIAVLKRKMLLGALVEQHNRWESVVGLLFTAISAAAPISGLVQIISGSTTAAYFSVVIGTITTVLTTVLRKNKSAQTRVLAKQQVIKYHLLYNSIDIELLKTDHEAEPHTYLERISAQLADLFADDPIIDEQQRAKFAARLRAAGVEYDDDLTQLQRINAARPPDAQPPQHAQPIHAAQHNAAQHNAAQRAAAAAEEQDSAAAIEKARVRWAALSDYRDKLDAVVVLSGVDGQRPAT